MLKTHILATLSKLINFKDLWIFNNKKKIHGIKKSLNIDGDKRAYRLDGLYYHHNLQKNVDLQIYCSQMTYKHFEMPKKLGVKIKFNNNFCEIDGLGLNGFKYKKNLVLDAGNSGTLGRLILGLLVHSEKNILLKGDKVYQKGFL